MLYIFIGPDGSGKTTLAKKVAEKNGFDYHKFSNKEIDKDIVAEQVLYDVIDLQSEDKSIIFDRFYYPDNLIYNYVLERDNEEKWLRVINQLSDINVTWVYVTADWYELNRRLKDRGDDYVTSEDVPAIKKEYERWLKEARTLFPNHLFITVDTTMDRYELNV